MEDRLRRSKTAAERRAQRLRSEARALQRVLTGITEVANHGGRQLMRVGGLLRELLLGSREATGSRLFSPAGEAAAVVEMTSTK
jgi:hypothetical protein